MTIGSIHYNLDHQNPPKFVAKLLSLSNSLWPHGLQHSKILYPSLSPRVCSNSCPLSRWCYLTISFSATPFSFCLQSFPASGYFPMCWLFTSGGQSIGASASAWVLPMNIQDWFPLGLTSLISLHSKGLSRVFFNTTTQSINSSAVSLLYGPTLHDWQPFFMVQPYTTTLTLTIWTFVWKVMSLLFNMLSRFVKAFLPRSKHHLTSMTGSNCCFLTCIQVSQETGKVVWYSHLRIFQFVVIPTKALA